LTSYELQAGRAAFIGPTTEAPRCTKPSRVSVAALDALGRTEEAKALRERYGVASSDDAKPLMRLYSGSPRTLLAKVKQQRRGFTGIFEVGGGGQLLWKSKWEEDPFGVAVLVTRSW